MAKLNWLDALFFGVRWVLAAGVELPKRPVVNFVGASVTDNPAENRIDIAFPGSGLRRIGPVVTSCDWRLRSIEIWPRVRQEVRRRRQRQYYVVSWRRTKERRPGEGPTFEPL